MKLNYLYILALFAATATAAQAALVWQVGIDDNGWPIGDGGGPNATFVQESGVNPLPGVPNSPEIDAQADDDYYFAGVYSTQVDGGPDYAPLAGAVLANEEAAERAFAGADNSLRYHFNLPATVGVTDLLTVTFDANNLHGQGGSEHYGVEIYFNSVLVMPEVDVNPGTLDFDFTTPAFTLASINAANGYAGSNIGSGFDNYVELRGINYNATGGGNWMGVDYVQLDAVPIPEPGTGALALFGLIAASPLVLRRRR